MENNYANNLNALESALANNLMSSYSGSSLSNLANYASTLGNLVSSMASQANNWTPTENTLGVNNVSTTMGNDTGDATAYARWKAMQDDLFNQGVDRNTAFNMLVKQGATPDVLRAIF